MLPETAKFLTLLREQTERLTQMTKTLLEMSNLQQRQRRAQLVGGVAGEDVYKRQIKDSGLRGRGGGGFPTGQKWFFARQSKGDVKYVC